MEATRTMISQIDNAVRAFEAAHDRLPDKLDELLGKNNHARTVPTDAWGTPFNYTKQGETFTVTSAGSDGIFGTADDLTN